MDKRERGKREQKREKEMPKRKKERKETWKEEICRKDKYEDIKDGGRQKMKGKK